MAGNGSPGATPPYIRDPWGIDRYSVPAAGTGLRQLRILGSIDGASGGLIPLPPIAGPQAVFGRPLTEVDLTPASAYDARRVREGDAGGDPGRYTVYTSENLQSEEPGYRCEIEFRR